MRKTPIALVIIGLTLCGCLGGIIAALVQPVHYQADAYVIVYEMPAGLRNVLGPDEANQVDAIYRAGALQDAVVNQVAATIPGQTAQTIRRNVQVSIVAYTPLTRVTATAATAADAATLANAVATAWTTYAATALDGAYQTAESALLKQESTLEDHIAQTNKSIAKLTPETDPQGDQAKALQAQLAEQLKQQTALQDQITHLHTASLSAPGNAYVATRASAADATQLPDPLKAIGGGTGAGFAVGIVFAVWIIRRHVMRQTHAPVAGTPDSIGVLA